MKFILFVATSIVLFLSASAVHAAIVINEIRTDQPGTDISEYFELAGEPAESLDGIWYLVIGDGLGGSGTIESATDLSGQSINSSGLFLAVKSTFENGAGQFFDGIIPDFVTSFNFENVDNVTHLLVSGFTGDLSLDLDTDDDGILNVTPWDSVIDAVGIVNTAGSGELLYSVALGGVDIGPDGSGAPQHVFRDALGHWQIGASDIATGSDTPGFANVPEPGSALLTLLGLVCICGFHKR